MVPAAESLPTGNGESERTEAKRETVEDDVQTTLREGRMILPGVQTLFGFQLGVLFTDYFQKHASLLDRSVHFASLSLVALTIVVVIVPAAYHRHVHPGVVSRRLTRFSTRCLKVALGLMTVGMGLNFYLITDITFHREGWAIVASALAFVVAFCSWFALPMLARSRRPASERAAERASPG